MLHTMTEEFRAEREARFQVVDRIRSRLPDLPPEEIELDVAQAIAAVSGPEPAGNVRRIMMISNVSTRSATPRAQAAVRLLRRLSRDELSQVVSLMPELRVSPPQTSPESTPQYWQRVLREERGDYHPSLNDEFLDGLTYNRYFALSAAEQDAFWDNIFLAHAWKIEDFEEIDALPDTSLAVG